MVPHERLDALLGTTHHTGVDPEELTDEGLAQAQDELGIEKQEVTEADRDAG